MMNEIATITFEDAETSSETWAFVRQDADHIGLGISLKDDGDIEVFMKHTDARKLSEALIESLA